MRTALNISLLPIFSSSITGRSAWNRLFDETMTELRFDVVGVLVRPDRPALVTHLRAAFL